MEVTGGEQFADHIARAARCVKMVDVGEAVWIDARNQRRDGGYFREILPIQHDASGAGHCE